MHSKKDGTKSWYVLWRDPDLGGKQTSLSFASSKQAETIRDLLNANGQRLSVVEKGLSEVAGAKKQMTLNQAFEKHLGLRTRANEDTKKDYRKIWENRSISASLGGLPIAKISEDDIRSWVQSQAVSYKPKTIANGMGLLSSVFKTASARGWAPGNPCEGVELSYGNATERTATFLTVDEFWTFHDQFAPRHSLIVRTFAASGQRFSELTALSVGTARDGLERDVPVLPVVRAWKEKASGGYYLGAPKAESVRDVSIPRDLADEILKATGNHDPDALVFGNKFGKQLRSSTFHAHGWQDAVKAAQKKGLRKSPRPHDLRHTHASWMLAEGMTVYDLSKRLGHKSTATTELIYGHLMPKALSEGASAIARAMQRR